MRKPPVSVECCEIPFPCESLVKKPVPCMLTSPWVHAGPSCAKAAEDPSNNNEKTARTTVFRIAIFLSPFWFISKFVSDPAPTIQRAVWPKPGKQRKISTAKTAIRTYSMTFSLRGRPNPSRYEAIYVDRQSFDISLVLPLL